MIDTTTSTVASTADGTTADGTSVDGRSSDGRPSVADLLRLLAATEDALRRCPRMEPSGRPNAERGRIVREQRKLQAQIHRRAAILRSQIA